MMPVRSALTRGCVSGGLSRGRVHAELCVSPFLSLQSSSLTSALLPPAVFPVTPALVQLLYHRRLPSRLCRKTTRLLAPNPGSARRPRAGGCHTVLISTWPPVRNLWGFTFKRNRHTHKFTLCRKTCAGKPHLVPGVYPSVIRIVTQQEIN